MSKVLRALLHVAQFKYGFLFGLLCIYLGPIVSYMLGRTPCMKLGRPQNGFKADAHVWPLYAGGQKQTKRPWIYSRLAEPKEQIPASENIGFPSLLSRPTFRHLSRLHYRRTCKSRWPNGSFNLDCAHQCEPRVSLRELTI